MKHPRTLLVAGLAFGLFASLGAQSTPAPRSYTSYFFFGDSLTDMGNTYALTGSPPSPYYNGRYSNGITYAEYLVSSLQKSSTAATTVTTNLNFAYAGATAATGSAVPTLAQQVAQYTARGLTPKSTELFVLLAGANDLLNYLSTNGSSSTGAGINASATTAASAVSSAVQTLTTAGAKNILVMNLPDISKTARFVTGSGASAATLAQGGSLTFNTAIKTNLAAVAASTGANVTLVDLGSMLNTIIANASKLGFTDTTHEVVGTLSAGGTVSNYNSYIFWDGIHPTTAVHALFASALTEVINPEFVLGTAAAQGNTLALAADLTADSIDSRLDMIRSSDRQTFDGYLIYNFGEGGLDAAGYRKQFNYSGSVVTGGFDGKITPHLTVGLAASGTDFSTNVKPGAGSFKTVGHVVTGYMVWQADGVFAELSGSTGSADLRKIVRITALGGLPATAETSAEQYGGTFKLGGNFSLSGVHLTPFAGLRYNKGRIDGYTETGVGGLNFQFDEQDLRSLNTLLGVSVSWQAHLGDMPLALGASAVHESATNGSSHNTGRLADTVASTATILTDTTAGDSFKIGARLSGAFSKRWGWTVGYNAAIRNDGDTGSQYSFAVQTGF